MIDMQYNFPLLPGEPGEWRGRLGAAVATIGDDDFAQLRPTFRGDESALVSGAAEWLRLPSGRLSLTSGAHHGTLVSLLAAGLAGKAVAVDAAAYTGGLELLRALGASPVGCAIDAEGMLPASLHAACERGRVEGVPVAGVFLTVSVHNPLGFVASLARREQLIGVAREFDLVVVEDDTYGWMAPDAPARLVDLAPERTFYVNTLSKSFAPAARTGFLVAPERYAGEVWRTIKNTATGNSGVHARAALGMVADGTLDRLISAKLDEGRRRNRAARAHLRDDRCWPGAAAAWHLWVRLPAEVAPGSFEQRMAERGVAVSGGNWFATGAEAPNGFRIALGGEVDAVVVERGVELVAQEMQRLHVL